MEKTRQPFIIAHRGASADAPENTMAAFQLAIEQGANSIELDIHLSKDQHLVVIHDESINRTTNGVGKVSDLTVAQLKKYDAGSWFHPKFSKEKIPLLEEVLQVLPKHILLNIEIKKNPSQNEGVEIALANLLERMNRIQKVIVSSFDHPCLLRLKEWNQNIKIGLLYSVSITDPLLLLQQYDVPITSLHPNYKTIRAVEIQKALDHGVLVFPWTVNSIEDMKRFISEGVSGIITNHPLKMKNILSGEKR